MTHSVFNSSDYGEYQDIFRAHNRLSIKEDVDQPIPVFTSTNTAIRTHTRF